MNEEVLRNNRSLVALVIAACVALLMGLSVPNAHADPSVTSGVNMRPCVDLGNGNCAPVGTTSGGMMKMRCWRDGSWATGNYQSNRWFLIVLNDGREGFVHSSFVGGQYPTSNCNELPYVRAADWAIARIGQRTQPSGRQWSGYCATLTYRAFTQGAGISYESGDALVQFRKYRDKRMIYGGLPRFGDPVFYDIARPWGHTAIYVGGQTVVTTQGMEGDNLPVARRGINSFSNYLGWARVG